MFYAVVVLGLAAFTAAIAMSAYLLLDAYRRRRLLLIGPIIVALAGFARIPASWAGAMIPVGTDYWGGANPLAVLIAWPVVTAILYGALWIVVPPQLPKRE
ncbi:MAG: hypothetical protein NT015_18935 [Alphaproteobacteria bacterium]|nr:hypothetical protein [Alphaproteobacteria bacterium]